MTPTPPVALKACPFCGGAARWQDDDPACDRFGLLVEHKAGCFLAGEMWPLNREGWTAAWNQRTPDAATMREACAKVADEHARQATDNGFDPRDAEHIAADIRALPMPAPVEAGIGAGEGEEEEWHSPDLRDLYSDVERFRGHDLGGQRLRDLLRATLDMLRAADVEMRHDSATAPLTPAADEQRAREVLADIVPLSISSTWDEAERRNIVRAMIEFATPPALVTIGCGRRWSERRLILPQPSRRLIERASHAAFSPTLPPPSARTMRRRAVGRLGMFETPVSAKSPVKCRRCGYAGLYWHDRKLHHWTCLTDDASPQFVLHRCGFDSRGNPRPLAQQVPA